MCTRRSLSEDDWLEKIYFSSQRIDKEALEPDPESLNLSTLVSLSHLCLIDIRSFSGAQLQVRRNAYPVINCLRRFYYDYDVIVLCIIMNIGDFFFGVLLFYTP